MLLLLSLIIASQAECEYPNQSIGDFNLTSERQLKEAIKKEPVFLIGLTASWCEECCQREPVYASLVQILSSYMPRIPLLRIDISKNPFIKKYLSSHETVPQIVGVRNGYFYRYFDTQNAEQMLRFADKLYAPVQYLNNFTLITEFLKQPTGRRDQLRVIALLLDNDLKKDFESAVTKFANWFTAEFRAVLNKSLIKQIRAEYPQVLYSNCVILLRGKEMLLLDLEVPQDISLWIIRNSIGLVEEVTPYNFQMYEANALPMLMMFLDPNNVNNDEYLDTFSKVARKYEEVRFAWVDGTNQDYTLKRRKLGLITDVLPSIAFNLGTQSIYPYPENQEISESRLSAFVKGYLEGKQYKPIGGAPNDSLMKNCERVGQSDFADKVLEEGYDAVFLVYSSVQNKESEEIAPIFDRVCRRFKELEFNNLRVFIVDTAKEVVHRSVRLDRIPAIYLASAYSKSPPFVHYTGKVDALHIMKFIEKFVGVKIELPELPHLNPDEVEEYWQRKKSDENEDL